LLGDARAHQGQDGDQQYRTLHRQESMVCGSREKKLDQGDRPRKIAADLPVQQSLSSKEQNAGQYGNRYIPRGVAPG
jgi:hypothetical protein